ncbi:MAG: hypothetical protein ABEL76_10855 [Bradymonadaceae bacterium]
MATFHRPHRAPALTVLAAAALLLGAGACASSPAKSGSRWPTARVLPESPPEALETDVPTTVLKRGPQGRLYAVGGLPDHVAQGSFLYARYSGRWPVDDHRRPALFAGRVLRTYGGEIALVHPTYQMPETDAPGLEVTWPGNSRSEPVGKGLASIASLNRSKSPSVAEISLGQKAGVRKGDIYALLQPLTPDRVGSPLDLQLSRRFRGICRVVETSSSSAACQLNRRLPDAGGPKGEEVALFLQHTLDAKPRPATVAVAKPKGADGETSTDLQDRVVRAIDSYIDSRRGSRTEVTGLDKTFSATRDDFYRVADQVEYDSDPKAVVGLEVREVDGTDHLFANYTAVGAAVGPGMVAAPPTGGVDLGPMQKIDGRELHPFAGVVWGALLVYRGANARAMLHLHRLLGDGDLTGPLRWHTRDQYAMRWGALDNFHESLWLVEQDEAVARRDGNRRARLNAMGTRVRLHDFLERPDRAVEAAGRFLEAYRADEADPQYLSALAMRAEMLAKAGRFEDVRSAIDRIADLCPDGCRGDAFAHYGSIYWALSDGKASKLRGELMKRIVDLGEQLGGRQLAAARLYQGTKYMGEQNFQQALIAILESGRLYKKFDDDLGLARAKYFELLANIGRDEAGKAFEAGKKSADLYRSLRDVQGLARTYRQMTGLFSRRKLDREMAMHLRSAREVLGEGFELNWAMGHYGKAAESLLDLSTFLFKFGRGKNAEGFLRRAVRLSLQSTRFDVAALAHLQLALLARQQNQRDRFKREVERAKIMAGLADDPSIKKAIERALNSNSQQPQREIPTQTL